MKKKIYVCPKCGRALDFSDNPEYTFQCFDCDEYVYECEAIVKEQERLEGIKDYTDLVKVSMEIGRITSQSVKESEKYIKIKSENILEQIGEYIYETVKPLIDSGIYKKPEFWERASIYHNGTRLRFSNSNINEIWLTVRTQYTGEVNVICFSDRGYSIVKDLGQTINLSLIENWTGLKESMGRMIPYALEEYNKAMQKKIERQKEKSNLIESFKL